jgi:hypothetical protein
MAMFREPSLTEWIPARGRRTGEAVGWVGTAAERPAQADFSESPIGTGLPGTPPVSGESAKIGKSGTFGRSGFIAVSQLARADTAERVP